jgi:uncharacterized protein YndB with AHSA1/START domain
MAESYRCHAVIDAPVEDVWAVVSDPTTHPQWWPEVEDVEMSETLGERGEFVRKTRRRLGFGELVDEVWVAERLEHLQEVHFRCTISGTYMRFALTPADEDTFVELEGGMLPTSARWRAVNVFNGPFMRHWMRDILDALPPVVEGVRSSPQRP